MFNTENIKNAAERFFKLYCNPLYYEDIKGDLNELHDRESTENQLSRANRRFALRVLLLFRPSIIRPLSSISSNWNLMLKNYLRISFRSIRKHPFNSVIHILGLALGLTAFLFINRYVAFEKSYDSIHDHADNLYRLTTNDVKDGRIQVRDAMSFAPSGRALKEELPQVIEYTTTYKTFRMAFRRDQLSLEERGILAVDSNFLKLFSYEVIEGDRETMFDQPYQIVLSEGLALKYFGSQDVVGKTIHVLGQFDRPFEVTGLIKDPPENIHYSFNGLVSLSSFRDQIERDAWYGYNYYTYLLMEEGANLEDSERQLPGLSRKYLGDDSRLQFNLQPVRDIHLHSNFTYEPEIHGSAKAVGFLGIISVFIILIAWVNYVNLSTARALERAKEVGLRKVVGASKGQLMGQFIFEALLINAFGAVIALTLAQALIPMFNALVGKTIISAVWTDADFLGRLAIFFALGTIVTGYYPALILSSFKPIGVLRGSFSRSRGGSWLRKTLVVIQFAASLILIGSTVVIYKQIRYMIDKDLGIEVDRVIGFDNPGTRGGTDDRYLSEYRTFTERLSNISGVENAGAISNLPGGGSAEISSSSGGIKIVGMTDIEESTIYITEINDQLLTALGVKLIEGRNFNHEFAGDSSAVILNQSLLQLLGVGDPESVINEYLQFGKNPDNPRFKIVGVIEDYNRSSLKNNIEPTVFRHNQVPACTVVKLGTGPTHRVIERIRDSWHSFFPDAPFTYTFLDQRFERLYLEDRKFASIFLVFTLLAIFVATMGLFGLSSYVSMQRAKEVGVRKVLGASPQQIVLLFFKDFFWLILIAMLIGLPLIFLGMNNWLSTYAYRIEFPWWVLVISVLSIILLAFITVSYQTLKLALLNPSQTLRHE